VIVRGEMQVDAVAARRRQAGVVAHGASVHHLLQDLGNIIGAETIRRELFRSQHDFAAMASFKRGWSLLPCGANARHGASYEVSSI